MGKSTTRNAPGSTPTASMPDSALIVEDDAVLALSIEQTLAGVGIEDITICNSTTAALAYLKQRCPDLLLLDIHIADRNDGYAIAELAMLLKPHAPQIIFSTGDPQSIPVDIAKMGILLEKPYAAEQLIAAIRKKPRGLIKRLLKNRN